MSKNNKTIFDLISTAASKLKSKKIVSARLDAEVLLAHVLKKSRLDIYLNRDLKLKQNQIKKFKILINKRMKYTPVAYLTGTKEFWSIPIIVTKDVLVPRPETEHIVEMAIEIAKTKKHPLNILDLCTGSGCIPAALAKSMPDATITVTDISKKALRVAKKNLKIAKKRTTFISGDLFKPLDKKKFYNKFDIIIANPPYIPFKEKNKLPNDVLCEPHLALFAKKDGLDFIERIINDAPRFLKSDGFVLIEIGFNVSKKVFEIAKKNKSYHKISVVKDLAGIDRVLILAS